MSCDREFIVADSFPSKVIFFALDKTRNLHYPEIGSGTFLNLPGPSNWANNGLGGSEEPRRRDECALRDPDGPDLHVARPEQEFAVMYARVVGAMYSTNADSRQEKNLAC